MTKYLVWIYQEGSERALLRAGDGQWHERAGGGAHCQLNHCNQVHHVAGPLVEKYIRQHLIFECCYGSQFGIVHLINPLCNC
jgi:hypothetical protein